MNNNFFKGLTDGIAMVDGSTGTMLHHYGMPANVSPEKYCLEHPELVEKIHQEYFAAGSDIVYTPTFGANRAKLGNYGLEKQAKEINQRLADISVRTAKKKNKRVAGDIGPTGLFFEPFGETKFDQGMEIYSEQIQGLAQAGVDCIVIETQIDLQEARIALLAAKENTHLPVMVSMTFDESQRTLTGSDPLSCLNVLQSLGADGFGINCSLGPDSMIPIIDQIAPYAKVPLLVKPNAGLPIIQNGETVFPLAAEPFAGYLYELWQHGVSIFGGCCGTTPDHIYKAFQKLAGKKIIPVCKNEKILLLSSARKTIESSPKKTTPIRIIGERINPTGKKDFQEELRNNDFTLLKKYAREQKENGAEILDVNVGMPGINESAIMRQAIKELAVISDLPLCIDSSNPAVIEQALRFYPGRVLINSLTAEKHKLEKIIPLIKKYGAAFIVLPVEDKGIPETIEERKRVLSAIFTACQEQNIDIADGVVDGLVMTIATNQEHAGLTLELIQYVTQTLGMNTVLGLSNISFGLPQREAINTAFFIMAAAQGLSLVIANPSSAAIQQAKRSAEALLGRDGGCREWLNVAKASNPATTSARPATFTLEQKIFNDIDLGEKSAIIPDIDQAVNAGWQALDVVQKIMIPAIQLVGEKYNRKEYFLPQLIAAAESMEKGVQHLMPYLEKAALTKKGTVVLATVKGDVHDIGKKIVGLLLKNNGYQVIDLGKSIDAEMIVDQAQAQQADFIGLSALMTTTMVEMPKVIQLVKARKLKTRVIIGGAVVTQKYADEISADGFAADAGQCVVLLERLLSL